MKAIGWLLVMLGIVGIIEGAHGNALWSVINQWLTKSGHAQTAAKKAS